MKLPIISFICVRTGATVCNLCNSLGYISFLCYAASSNITNTRIFIQQMLQPFNDVIKIDMYGRTFRVSTNDKRCGF